ncbi:MAG: hypothetical protein M3P85_00710 [Actinomycetota bacterium]|nr:hypothetical protein [Actinomycetota bacterium]PLS74812.1 MAG: hypothetical protein CYG61_10900 [Actinomycetota bacterium]
MHARISVRPGATLLPVDDTTTDARFDAVNRIDGLQMLAFAVMIAASIGIFRSSRLIGARMATTATAAAAAALVASGIGCLTLNPALGAAALISLPLLLVWVAYTGVAVSRTAR